MDVVPVSERILQLRDNWFLIYATSAFTAYVSCLNSTSSEFHLKMGVNRIPLSPTCQLKLKDHVLFADNALRVESQIRELAWNLEDEAFSKSEVNEATDVLDQISAEGDTSRHWPMCVVTALKAKLIQNGSISSFLSDC